MSILSKDWQYAVVPVGTVTQGAGTAVAVYDTTTPYVGDAIPIIVNYPAISESALAQDIRVCSQTEVAMLKEHLYGGFAEPLKTTYFNQLLYSGNYGKPLYVWTGGNYIAAWYGALGLGFYVFIGYNYLDYPTQTINVESIQRA